MQGRTNVSRGRCTRCTLNCPRNLHKNLRKHPLPQLVFVSCSVSGELTTKFKRPLSQILGIMIIQETQKLSILLLLRWHHKLACEWRRIFGHRLVISNFDFLNYSKYEVHYSTLRQSIPAQCSRWSALQIAHNCKCCFQGFINRFQRSS